jgi:hypothetical protein
MVEHPDHASVQSMAFVPDNPNVLYVLYSGGDNYRRIERLDYSSSGGWNGTWINDNLPSNLNTTVICGDANNPDIVYVGTIYNGVWRGDCTKPTYDRWSEYNDGFPWTYVTDLKIDPSTKKLRAATMGRGVWEVITGP